MTHKKKPGSEVVCLVDDDLAVLKSIERLLTSDGLSVCSFQEPKKFLAHLEVNPVALVILDIWMEQMTGLQVQARLGELSPDTRVIIITGREDPDARQTTLEAGAVAFFTKPFDGEQFLAAVHRALEPDSQK